MSQASLPLKSATLLSYGMIQSATSHQLRPGLNKPVQGKGLKAGRQESSCKSSSRERFVAS